MLNLDQVRLLENRVEKAVAKIQSLTAENTHVRSQLSTLQNRVNELEGLVRAFKDDQGRIEEGILNALERLSAFEDSVYQADDPLSKPDSLPTPSAESMENDTESISDDELVISEPEPIQINAEWQDSSEDKTPPRSSDGQMDIF